MAITIDFPSLKDAAVLEPGTYSAQVDDFLEGTTKAGKPKVTFVFSLTDEGYEGRKVYADYALSDNALPFLRRTLIALGFDLSELRDKFTLSADDLVGIQCRVVIETSYTPKGTYNRVKTVMRQRDEDSDNSLDDSDDFWEK